MCYVYLQYRKFLDLALVDHWITFVFLRDESFPVPTYTHAGKTKNKIYGK